MVLGNTPRRETNLAVEASKSYVLGLYFVQQSANESEEPFPLDLTGCEVRFVMADPPQRGAPRFCRCMAVLDQPENGLAQLKFQAADLTLEPGPYAYDVTLYPPSGYSTPILKGYVEIGANTDLYDDNVYTDLNITTDITVMVAGHDSVTIVIERVDGMFLVVSELIEDFAVDMQAQVDAAAASRAGRADLRERGRASYKNAMQVWLNNAGFPFWQGTQAQYDLLQRPARSCT